MVDVPIRRTRTMVVAIIATNVMKHDDTDLASRYALAASGVFAIHSTQMTVNAP